MCGVRARSNRTQGFTFDLTQTGEGKGSNSGGEDGVGKPVVRDHPLTGLPQVRTVEFAPSSSEPALQACVELCSYPPSLILEIPTRIVDSSQQPCEYSGLPLPRALALCVAMAMTIAMRMAAFVVV
jgi:hypothetical protein